MIWVRVAYPRLREDQLQRLAWQVLVPLALLQLALTGVVTGGDGAMMRPIATGDREARLPGGLCRAGDDAARR